MFNAQARWDIPLPRDNTIAGEPIEVTVLFKPGKFLPLAFSLRGNGHRVKKIEFVWKEKIGQEIFYLFSVSDTLNNLHTICFSRQSMCWRLILED